MPFSTLVTTSLVVAALTTSHGLPKPSGRRPAEGGLTLREPLFQQVRDDIDFIEGKEKRNELLRKVNDRRGDIHVIRRTPEQLTLSRNVGILIPFREQNGQRQDELNSLLATLVPHARDLSATTRFHFFIVEQSEKGGFNRGALLNVAFDRAAKLFEGEAFSVVVQDCDFIPDADMIKWYNRVGTSPIHLANDYYQGGFGEVTVFTADQFKAINGFPNNFAGWGVEDDDAMDRWISQPGRTVIAPTPSAHFLDVGEKLHALGFRDMAKYDSNVQRWWEDNAHIPHTHLQRWMYNGLSNLGYTLRETKQSNDVLIEHIVVDVA